MLCDEPELATLISQIVLVLVAVVTTVVVWTLLRNIKSAITSQTTQVLLALTTWTNRIQRLEEQAFNRQGIPLFPPPTYQSLFPNQRSPPHQPEERPTRTPPPPEVRRSFYGHSSNPNIYTEPYSSTRQD